MRYFRPPPGAGLPDPIRLWNSMLISFAGYEDDRGRVTGNKAAVKFTKV